jgi:hypothetical protein
MGVCDLESPTCSPPIVWTKESHICFSIYQSTTAFAFIESCSLNTSYSRIWLCVVTMATINWYIIRLRNFCNYSSSNVCLSMEHVLNFRLSRTIQCTVFSIGIDEWYCKDTLIGLIGCAIISASSLTTLVSTTCIIVSFIFLLW